MGWKGLLPRTLDDAGITKDGDVTLIPYYRRDGTLFRARHKTQWKEWWGPGMGTIPYGLETLPNGFRARRACLCITEGESDALALREVLRGTGEAVYVLASPGATAWRQEWEVYTAGFNLVVVLGDGDAAGQAFVERMTRTRNSGYGWDTSRLVPGSVGATMAPGEDVRSVIQEISADEVIDMIREMVELQNMLREHFPDSST